jgi:transcriptional regulator with GAF, ATPase, and Fis domain
MPAAMDESDREMLTPAPGSGYYQSNNRRGQVKRRADLIDQFTELVIGADDPRRLAERTLEVVMSLTNGRAGAVFTRSEDRMTLFASRGIDQEVLDVVQNVWSGFHESLEGNEVFYVPDRPNDRRLPRPEAGSVPAAFAVVPVFQDGELIALLYVDSLDPHFCASHDLERLQKFTRIVAKAVTDSGDGRPRRSVDAWETYLERTPVEDMEREKLLLLLNRNEWNIARVARLMGVTRRTIYLRLERYKIPRERVRKSKPRPATA